MADESVLGPQSLVEIIKKDAAEIVKVKVMKQGGIHRTFQMIEMAEAAGIKCVIGHGFGLAINTLAEVHVAASCRNLLEGCEFVGPLKIEQDVVKSPLQMDTSLLHHLDLHDLGPQSLVEIIKKDAAEIVKVKVMKQGGIHRTFQMIEMAEAAGIKCVIGHGFGLAINTLAEVHVAASCRNLLEGCEFVGPLKIEQDVVKRPLQMESGKIKVPQGSGLGVELDENRLKQCILA